jgi:hypothetical protein
METTLKLSEAILAGSRRRPQGKNELFVREGFRVRSCALGAAYEAVFGRPRLYSLKNRRYYYDRLKERFPVLDEMVHDGAQKRRLLHAISARNDSLGWTREQIAVWLKERAY